MLGFRLVLAPRLAVSRKTIALTTAVGVVTGLAVCALFLIAVGVPADALGEEFVVYVFGNTAGLDQTITRAIPLILVGLSVAMALQVKFWNVGVEGQSWVGAIGATSVVLYHFGPMALHLPIMFLVAALGGGLWCVLPALAKIWLRADEVVTTLLMNYIGYLWAQDLLYGSWRNPEGSFPVSTTFAPVTERLPNLGFGHVHAGLVIALAAALFCWWLVARSRVGFMARAIAANPVAARATGIPVDWIILLMVMLAGALSGMAGFTLVAGLEYKLTQFIGRDLIFPSIVIAYLGRANPIGVVVASFAIAGIYTAGDSLKAFYQLPQAVVTTIEALLLLTVSAFDFFQRYRVVVVRATPPITPNSLTAAQYPAQTRPSR